MAYISLFHALKDLAISRGLQFSPQLILSDFESGLISAIQAKFPEAHHQDCYFHFTEAIWKKVQHLGACLERALVQRTYICSSCKSIRKPWPWGRTLCCNQQQSILATEVNVTNSEEENLL
ncbi:hypothetical protein R1flu_004287 [Riccia fluitans]|uniref:MULE transposase domain-containing protein n=1 Tax=Riccia fluitans TaxID=41844 RepID=A0ABD1YPV1_9MARC